MLDFLKPKVLEQVQSKYSGLIRVVKGSGDVYIATGPLTQSGSIVEEVWEGTLKKHGQEGKTWLILGLAGGTIAGYISKKLRPKKMVGVEIDPVMIDLGRRFMSLDNIPKLEIVESDAKKYLNKLKNSSKPVFDYVLVDMYMGDKLPDFVYSDRFLNQVLKIGRIVIFNHLFYDSDKKSAAEGLITKLKLIFPQVTLIRKLTNLLIICQSVPA